MQNSLIKTFVRYIASMLRILARPITTNRLFRKLKTNNFSSRLLAVGERNIYGITPNWITMDVVDSDINTSLDSATRLPFDDNSLKAIYTSHTVEHLPKDTAKQFYKECFRCLEKGGVLRVEAPDSEKIFDAYVEKDLGLFEQLPTDATGKKFEPYSLLLGTISSHFDTQGDLYFIQSNEELVKEKVAEGLESFTEWCISLQSEEQIRSGGHNNPFYFSKIKNELTQLGFASVQKASPFKSTQPAANFKSSLFYQSIERIHRDYYSLRIEAVK